MPFGIGPGMILPELAYLGVRGTRIAVPVTPKASHNAVLVADGVIRVLVAAVPEGGKATAAATALLAEALGIAKSRLHLLRGATSRQELFQVR